MTRYIGGAQRKEINGGSELEFGIHHVVELDIQQTLELPKNCCLYTHHQVHTTIPLHALHQMNEASTV